METKGLKTNEPVSAQHQAGVLHRFVFLPRQRFGALTHVCTHTPPFPRGLPWKITSSICGALLAPGTGDFPQVSDEKIEM